VKENFIIAICDDIKYERKKIKKLVEEYCNDHEINAEVTEYSSAEEYLEAEADADILLLDEEMSGISGVELKDRLFFNTSDTRIIFVTSHDEIMPEAYGVNVVGFVVKPVNTAVFNHKMDTAVYSIQKMRSAKEIPADNESHIDIENILYIKTDDKYTKIYHVDGSVTGEYKPLSSYCEKYAKDLFRIHKSYAINLKYAGAISEENINGRHETRVKVTNTGEKLPLGRRQKKEYEIARKKYNMERLKANGINNKYTGFC